MMQTRNFFFGACLVLTVLVTPVSLVQAQGISLTITPTLFEMSAVPQQAWDTSLRVVNNNQTPLTIYAEPVNFIPRGERGHSSFLPLSEEGGDGTTLAEWMAVPTEPITIPAESSHSIDVNIRVPDDANPGGHYAAILVGTRPPTTDGAMSVQTSQIISSLFFLRIAGDVVEDGSIRTFRPDQRFVTTPEQTLLFRFQNVGNVHLRPEGRIVIENMWGKERGVIPINQESNFGNVLPESVREFEFTWRGDSVATDFGRYVARLTLGYGSEQRQFVTRETYFWVVPVQPLLITFAILFFAFWFIRRTIKAYVRYMLRLSGIDPDASVYDNAAHHTSVPLAGDVRISRRSALQAPVRKGVRDFRDRLHEATAFFDSLRAVGGFIFAYRVFFGSLVVAIALFALTVWYFSNVTVDTRDYEVTIENTSAPQTISSEEQYRSVELATSTVLNSDYVIEVVNASEEPGAAARVADQLTTEGYRVSNLRADLETERASTVIVYHPNTQAEALAISQLLDGAALSAFPESNTSDGVELVTVYVGNDKIDD